MGWYFVAESLKEAHREAFGSNPNVLKSCSRAYGRRVWTLERLTNGETMIALYLFQQTGGQWGYKPISEDMGPYERDCPVSYIKEATWKPEPGSYTEGWRATILSKAEGNKRNRDFARTLEYGDMVKSTKSGKTYRFLRKEKRGLVVADGHIQYLMSAKDAVPGDHNAAP